MVSVTVGEELYGLPLEEFIPERASLAKSLRAKGRRDDANVVTALRKPSVAAWAVNQLIRTRAADTARLFGAGDQMRSVQDGLLAGNAQPAALREAAAAERVARDELVEIARGLLSASGHQLSGSTLSRVDETLHAASLDPDARAELADGCLVRELRLAGLGIALGADSPAGAAPSARPQKRSTKSGQTTAATASRRVTDADRSGAVRSSRKDATRRKRPRRNEEDAGRGAQRTPSEPQPAERHRDRAAATLNDAERSEVARSKRDDAARLRQLRRDEQDAGRAARRAASELQAAQQRLDRAAATLNDAERALDKATVRAEAAESAHRAAVAARQAFQAATDDDRTQ